MVRWILGVVFAVALVGCGGGGSDSSAPAPVPQSASAEGIWNGTTNNGATVMGFVLDDGAYYAVYTAPYSSSITGIVLGSGSSNNGTYTTTNAKDFYFGSSPNVMDATISGNYLPMQTFSGTASYSNGTSATFSSTYDTRYDQTPSLATLAGTYSGSIVGGSTSTGVNSDSASITIASTGTFSGTSALGCSFSGSVAPRSHGNVYNVSISMGASPCLFANQTLNGMIFYGSDTKRAFAAAPTADRSGGFLFAGTRQ
ncbi:MAG: hypothetical protein PHN92_08520 [Geobacter sp.]|nr:hypothetical protein [Geobacter sp.]